MNSSRRDLLLLFFSLYVLFGSFVIPVTNADNLKFEFPSFSLRNLTLIGDSYLRNGVIGLTRELNVPSSSSGSVICNTPIAFFDRNTNISASFSTKFSFSISNMSPGSYGDGLAFFISQDNQTIGSTGGYLGLVNSSQLTKNKFVAVEFDTRLDPQFNDPNDNHIGLDIDNLISIKTADPNLQEVDLKSGKMITSWIDYENNQKILKVWLSYSNFRPEKPILSVGIDLSMYFKEFMYVGFSASTEGSTELHFIEDWTFQTFGFLPPVRPHSQPHNVSSTSVTVVPGISISNSTNNSHKKLALGLGISGPAFFFVVLVVFGWVSVKKWREIRTRQNFRPELMKGPRQFRYFELNFATKGFHSSRIVGHGSFGTVYKAIFPEPGTTYAVKRSKHTHDGQSEFLAELSIIACLGHKNLVQLQGWCTEKSELLLVYEFMANGSLDNVLYEEPDKGVSLKWYQRYNIAIGIASALKYLHQECEQQVIHRDIKTSNIMLDVNFNPKLGDFGLARLMEHDKSPASTLTAGTMGYLAPEYLQYGKATEKTDIFSFGVVILELACGRRPIEKEQNNQKMVNLVDWVWNLHSAGNLLEAADKRLNGEFKEEEMRKLLLVGLSCANPDCTYRPPIRKVLQILKNEAEPDIVPRTKPTLTFSCGLPLSLEDIVSDKEVYRQSTSPLYEISIK